MFKARRRQRGPWFALAAIIVARAAAAEELTYKDRLPGVLEKRVPGILKTFDPGTGRFGSGIWICGDQEQMYPLAVAYARSVPGSRYHQDARLLEVIMKAGDALIADMDERGQWMFRKKDGSTWGKIWMPWTYSRWARTFGLVRDQMPPERRTAWAKALTLGYTGIARTALGHVHNIPAHHAMGLYAAGKALDRPEWCKQAAEFLVKVAGQQSEGGYWSEGVGPVVLYDFVYVDALGTYYAMSGDRRVLPALEKAAAFHRHFTYPSGQSVETIDQRNPYHETVAAGNVGFSFTPVGRAYLKQQWSRLGIDQLDPDLMASLILYGEEGPTAETAAETEAAYVLREGGADRAAVWRRGPWFVCLSAYTAPVAASRWHQDRQNFVSIFHDKTGLILGGGNTKLQPAWSNFTVGDATLLTHKPGDENPDFLPKGKLFHVPSAARLAVKPALALDLTYGPESCRIEVLPEGDRALQYRIQASAKSELPVAAHLTCIPHLGKALETAAGARLTLGSAPLELAPAKIGAWVAHAGWRWHVPPSASLHWPALPHNPYRKDGRAAFGEGRIEIRIPFDQTLREHSLRLEILP